MGFAGRLLQLMMVGSVTCHICGSDTDDLHTPAPLPGMNDAPYVMGCLHILTLSTGQGAFVHQYFGRYGIVYVRTQA